MTRSTKESICQAAVPLFAQQGYERTTIEDIAVAAGTAKGTIFYHFGTKRELFIYTVRLGLSKWLRTLENITAGTGPFIEKLSAVIDSHLTFVNEEQDLVRLILSEVPELRWRQEVKVLHEEFTTLMHELLNQGKVEGVVNADLDVHVTTHTLFGAIMILALDSLILEEGIDWKSTGANLKQLLLTGITGG